MARRSAGDCQALRTCDVHSLDHSPIRGSLELTWLGVGEGTVTANTSPPLLGCLVPDALSDRVTFTAQSREGLNQTFKMLSTGPPSPI